MMTTLHIKKIKESIEYLKKIKVNPTTEEIVDFDDKLSNFFGSEYTHTLLYTDNRSCEWYTGDKSGLCYDIDCLIFALEGMLARETSYGKVSKILDLIEEGQNLATDYETRRKFVVKIYYGFHNIIKFDKDIAEIAKDSINSELSLNQDFIDKKLITDGMIAELIYQLNEYADYLLQEKPEIEKSERTPQQQFIISNNNYQNQEQSQSVEIMFSQLLGDLQNQGLSDTEFIEITKQLIELENERKKNDKKSVWEKAKGILKYLLDKSIQIGVAVLPYIASAIK